MSHHDDPTMVLTRPSDDAPGPLDERLFDVIVAWGRYGDVLLGRARKGELIAGIRQSTAGTAHDQPNGQCFHCELYASRRTLEPGK